MIHPFTFGILSGRTNLSLSARPSHRMTLRRLLAVSLMAFPAIPPASADVPRLHLKPVSLAQLDSPTVITHANDGSGRLFVCDQPGQVHIIRQGMLLPTPFLDLSPTGLNHIVPMGAGYSERGLLGLAFHPDYELENEPGSGRFYVYYSAPSAGNPNPSTPQNHITVVSEFRVSSDDPDRADPDSERILLTFGQPQSNHNGGQLEFGADRYLYIGSGDGGSSDDNNSGHTGGNNTQPAGVLGNALDTTNLLGKILRIDPLGSNGPGGSYGIPASNPYTGLGGGVREEIYAHGLRNPWRFSFDHRPGGTGRLFCGDVGQGKVEEVNLITSGGNYGWRYREGSFEFDPVMTGTGNAPATWIDPIAQYAHPGISIGAPAIPQLGVSITGGYVYRGDEMPSLRGLYIFADYRASPSTGGRIMALEETTPLSGTFTLIPTLSLTEENPLSGNRRILTLGEDERGELYVGTKTSGNVLQRPGGIPEGAIYQLVPAASTSLTLTATRDTSLFENTSNSNGAGENLYAGRTGSMAGNARRRALVRFDLSTLPNQAVVETAAVELHQTLGGSAPVSMTLHRVTSDWGEALSDSGTPGGSGAPARNGDATWTHRFHPGTPWLTAGGDVIATPSATTVIDSTAPDGPVARTWSGAGLVGDVHAWLASPPSNFGWAVIGDETGEATAQRFASRESSLNSGTLRPKLRLGLSVPPPPSPFEAFLLQYDPTALPGTYFDVTSDEDGDGLPLLLEHGLGLNPRAATDQTLQPLRISVSPLPGGATKMNVTFLRDPTATDVILTVLIGSDPNTSLPVAHSTRGATPQTLNGATLLEDSEIPGAAPRRYATITIEIPAGDARQFARLEAEFAP